MSDLVRRVEELRADKDAAEKALAEARAARKAMKVERDRFGRTADAGLAAQRLENDALREEMERLAAEILRLAAAGGTEPPPVRPDRRRPRLTAVAEPAGKG